MIVEWEKLLDTFVTSAELLCEFSNTLEFFLPQASKLILKLGWTLCLQNNCILRQKSSV